MVGWIVRTTVWRALAGNAVALPIATLLALALSTTGLTPAGATTLMTDEATGESDGHDHGEGHGHDHSADAPTAEERLAADQLVAATQAAATRLADFAVAETEGYLQVTPYVLGHGPAHFVNPAYVADGVYLDPDRPESLVYLL